VTLQASRSDRRSLFRVGPESSWTTILPVAFIIASLVSLVVFPLVLASRTAATRSEINSLGEPARLAASTIQIGVANELDNIIGYQVTGQAQYLRAYRSAVDEQRRKAALLKRLAPRLGDDVPAALAAFLAATERWHQGAKEAEFLERQLPSPVFTTRLFERHPSYENTLKTAAELQATIQGAIDVRAAQIRANEKLNVSLTTVLAVLALTSSLMVAGLGRQMRLLAKEAMARRREAEREAVEAKLARAAAEKQERRSTFLATASRELTSSLDFQETVRKLTRLVVPNIGDLCLMDMAEPGGVKRTAVAHRDPRKEESLSRTVGTHREQMPEAFVEAMKRPDARIVGDGATLLSQIVGLEGDASATQYNSLLLVPLVSRGQALGILTIAAASGRTFSEDDAALSSELARHAALAMDNARLYLESQQAVRAREEVLAIVSHDLRNPLSAIMLSASMLQMIQVSDPDEAEQLEIIEVGARRMSRLIEDLLDVTRMEGGKALPIEPAALEIESLFREANEIFKPQAAAGSVTLDYSVPEGTPQVHADRHRVMQVLSNLVGNALKFTPAGGVVSFRAESLKDEVLLTVADTGPGIPEENLSDIFNPYWQAKRTARMGAGLGLPIAKGIVEAHHGRIWVESEPGKGTKFCFTLPLQRHGTLAEAEPESAASVMGG
jgi:signal transduction histidine kinase